METERRYLFKKSDNYLFSIDVRHQMRQAGRGWSFAFQRDDRAVGFDVFNVKNESVVNEREAFVGEVLSVVGRNEFRSYGDAASTDGKMLIRARDGVVIESVYYGTNRLQELAQRRLLTAKDPQPIEVKLSYWLRFDSTSAKYRWLVQSACVGFGRGVLKPYTDKNGEVDKDGDGFPAAFTYATQLDIYALS